MVKQLPPMDFYVPRPNDRRTWTGAADIVVGATLENDAPPPVVWTAEGRRARANRNESAAVFLIEPSEAKDLRIKPQRAIPGLVIQDADDGTTGGALLRYDADGKLLAEIQLAHLLSRPARPGTVALCQDAESCDSSGGGDGVPGGPSDTTRLDRFTCDGWDGWGGIELEFRSKYYDAAGRFIAAHTLRQEFNRCSLYSTGNPGIEYFWRSPLIYNRVWDNTAEFIWVELVETDWLSNDRWGNRYFYWTDNGQVRGISGGGVNSELTLAWTPKRP
jgi:hypothetical protein